MNVLISGKNYTLNYPPLGSGGEGEVYKIEPQLTAKIYHKTIINRDRRLKVLAFCNSYANNALCLGDDYFGFPKQPAYENNEVFDFLCGFSMKFFPNLVTLGDIGYNLSAKEFNKIDSIKLDDDKAVQLIYNIFDVVNKLHQTRIILGDVNPSNISYNNTSNYPIVIDFDSAQVGQFKCLAWSDEYIDPFIQQQGKNMQGGYTYSYESDNFSIACVCFELFIGINPFFVRTDPSNDIVYNKENGVSILRYVHSNKNDWNGIKYLSIPVNENIKSRILTLKTKYPQLYDFFISTFIDNCRNNLMQTLDRSNYRHPAYVFFSQSGFDTALGDYLSKRQQAKSTQPIQQTQNVIGTFTIPDSGFSKIISTSSINTKSKIQTPLVKNKTKDPDQLLLFLKTYLIDATNTNGVA